MPKPSPDVPVLDPVEIFEEQLPRIDRVLSRTARRRSLSEEETDELRSFTYQHLLANDCAILRRYRGECRWTTYLTVVVQRLFLDFRNHRWGKWRPCAKARRRGEEGILLDQLLHRDGFEVEEAIQILQQNHQVRVPAEVLRRWAAELPRRGRPRQVGEECLGSCPSEERTDAVLLASETARGLDRVRRCLHEALAGLPAQDRLVVKMRYLDGFRISEIARTLGLPQKPLYRRIPATLRRLRGSLEAKGCSPATVVELLEEG